MDKGRDMLVNIVEHLGKGTDMSLKIGASIENLSENWKHMIRDLLWLAIWLTVLLNYDEQMLNAG